MKVHNLKGTSADHYRKVGLKDWMEYKGVKNAPVCSASDCNNLATDGAHVQKVGSGDKNWYICPMCHKHNESTDDVALRFYWPNRLVALSEFH